METVREHCQVCRQITTWGITKVTPSRVSKKEAIIAIRCTKCGRVSLRKVDQEIVKNE